MNPYNIIDFFLPLHHFSFHSIFVKNKFDIKARAV
jgi:hypothetical protein